MTDSLNGAPVFRPSVMNGHDDFGGLARDLPRLLNRRHALKAIAAAGLFALAGCSSESSGTVAEPGSSSAALGGDAPLDAGLDTGLEAASADGSCVVIPQETAGPFPGDGSNGPNVLNQDGVIRSDIRTSIGTASGTAQGIPLTVTLKLSSTAGCAPLAGGAVYLWHATREGEYSMYSTNVANENFLRGVQVAGDDGAITFQTIFPGCYDGRWPHMHFEVYQDEASALAGESPLAGSQIAMPADACSLAYAADGYETSLSNFSRTSLESDFVFSDTGGATQLPTWTGDATAGFSATLAVAV